MNKIKDNKKQIPIKVLEALNMSHSTEPYSIMMPYQKPTTTIHLDTKTTNSKHLSNTTLHILPQGNQYEASSSLNINNNNRKYVLQQKTSVSNPQELHKIITPTTPPEIRKLQQQQPQESSNELLSSVSSAAHDDETNWILQLRTFSVRNSDSSSSEPLLDSHTKDNNAPKKLAFPTPIEANYGKGQQHNDYITLKEVKKKPKNFFLPEKVQSNCKIPKVLSYQHLQKLPFVESNTIMTPPATNLFILPPKQKQNLLDSQHHHNGISYQYSSHSPPPTSTMISSGSQNMHSCSQNNKNYNKKNNAKITLPSFPLPPFHSAGIQANTIIPNEPVYPQNRMSTSTMHHPKYVSNHDTVSYQNNNKTLFIPDGEHERLMTDTHHHQNKSFKHHKNYLSSHHSDFKTTTQHSPTVVAHEQLLQTPPPRNNEVLHKNNTQKSTFMYNYPETFQTSPLTPDFIKKQQPLITADHNNNNKISKREYSPYLEKECFIFPSSSSLNTYDIDSSFTSQHHYPTTILNPIHIEPNKICNHQHQQLNETSLLHCATIETPPLHFITPPFIKSQSNSYVSNFLPPSTAILTGSPLIEATECTAETEIKNRKSSVSSSFLSSNDYEESQLEKQRGATFSLQSSLPVLNFSTCSPLNIKEQKENNHEYNNLEFKPLKCCDPKFGSYSNTKEQVLDLNETGKKHRGRQLRTEGLQNNTHIRSRERHCSLPSSIKKKFMEKKNNNQHGIIEVGNQLTTQHNGITFQKHRNVRRPSSLPPPIKPHSNKKHCSLSSSHHHHHHNQSYHHDPMKTTTVSHDYPTFSNRITNKNGNIQKNTLRASHCLLQKDSSNDNKSTLSKNNIKLVSSKGKLKKCHDDNNIIQSNDSKIIHLKIPNPLNKQILINTTIDSKQSKHYGQNDIITMHQLDKKKKDILDDNNNEHDDEDDDDVVTERYESFEKHPEETLHKDNNNNTFIKNSKINFLIHDIPLNNTIDNDKDKKQFNMISNRTNTTMNDISTKKLLTNDDNQNTTMIENKNILQKNPELSSTIETTKMCCDNQNLNIDISGIKDINQNTIEEQQLEEISINPNFEDSYYNNDFHSKTLYNDFKIKKQSPCTYVYSNKENGHNLVCLNAPIGNKMHLKDLWEEGVQLKEEEKTNVNKKLLIPLSEEDTTNNKENCLTIVVDAPSIKQSNNKNNTSIPTLPLTDLLNNRQDILLNNSLDLLDNTNELQHNNENVIQNDHQKTTTTSTLNYNYSILNDSNYTNLKDNDDNDTIPNDTNHFNNNNNDDAIFTATSSTLTSITTGQTYITDGDICINNICPNIGNSIAQAHVIQLDVDDTLIPTSEFCENNWLEKPLEELPEDYKQKLAILDEQLTRLFRLLYQMVAHEDIVLVNPFSNTKEDQKIEASSSSSTPILFKEGEYEKQDIQNSLTPQCVSSSSSPSLEQKENQTTTTVFITNHNSELSKESDNLNLIKRNDSIAFFPHTSSTVRELNNTIFQTLPGNNSEKPATPRGVSRILSPTIVSNTEKQSLKRSSNSSTRLLEEEEKMITKNNSNISVPVSKKNYLLSVVVVTNATMSHIRTVFPRFLPKLTSFFNEKQILLDDLVCSARDIWGDEFPFEQFYDFWKCWTLEDVLNQFRQDGIDHITVLSIGDDEPERRAAAYVRQEMSQVVKGLKLIKMISHPNVLQLSLQMEYILKNLRRFIQLPTPFDIQLRLNDVVLEFFTNKKSAAVAPPFNTIFQEFDTSEMDNEKDTKKVLSRALTFLQKCNNDDDDDDIDAMSHSSFIDVPNNVSSPIFSDDYNTIQHYVSEYCQILPLDPPRPFEAALIQFELKFEQFFTVFSPIINNTTINKPFKDFTLLDHTNNQDLNTKRLPSNLALNDFINTCLLHPLFSQPNRFHNDQLRFLLLGLHTDCETFLQRTYTELGDRLLASFSTAELDAERSISEESLAPYYPSSPSILSIVPATTTQHNQNNHIITALHPNEKLESSCNVDAPTEDYYITHYMSMNNLTSEMVLELIHNVMRFLLLYPTMFAEFTERTHQYVTLSVAQALVDSTSFYLFTSLKLQEENTTQEATFLKSTDCIQDHIISNSTNQNNQVNNQPSTVYDDDSNNINMLPPSINNVLKNTENNNTITSIVPTKQVTNDNNSTASTMVTVIS